MQVDGVRVEVVRKAIKHMHLRVCPPDGRVRVSVPRLVREEAVREAIHARLGWIRRHRARVLREAAEKARRMDAGEIHWVQGRPVRLEVIELDGPPSVALGDGRLELRVRAGSTREKREAVLEAWCRARLRAQIPELLLVWEERIGVWVAEVRIKRMKTRWGSCNVGARRIWLNLELARRAPALLEGILVHEMVHLLEPSHGPRFVALMDRFLPDWRERRAALDRPVTVEIREG